MLTDSDPELPPRSVRWWLVAALAVAMCFTVLVLRSFGPIHRDAIGVLIFPEGFAAVGIIVLILPNHSRQGPRGAALAYFAASFIGFVVLGMAIFPGGAPSRLDPSRPAPLDTSQSFWGAAVAVAVVMIGASFYARGRARTRVNVLTFILLAGGIAIKVLIFR
jgi:hypothetical protein